MSSSTNTVLVIREAQQDLFYLKNIFLKKRKVYLPQKFLVNFFFCALSGVLTVHVSDIHMGI